jgi:hypothetical protein
LIVRYALQLARFSLRGGIYLAIDKRSDKQMDFSPRMAASPQEPPN